MWRSTLPHKSPKKEEGRRELELFLQWAKEGETVRLFVLALYLERKKRLIRREIRGELFYEVVETGEWIAVPRAALKESEVGALLEEIHGHLSAHS